MRPRAVRRPGVTTVWRWELRRLLAQPRIRATLAIGAAGPWLLVLGLHAQDQIPKDTLFGLWVHTSGWSIPLVVLGFATTWAVPILTSAIAGGVFAADDEAGFWAPLMTRGRCRGEIFAGKVLAALTLSAVAVAFIAASAIVAGLVTVGSQPLVGLSGNQVAGGHLALLVIESWALVLPPVLGFAMIALMVSVVTRNSVAAVISPVVLGLLMQLDSFLTGGDVLRHLLLTAPMSSWDGLFTQPQFHYPIWRGLTVSAVWFVAGLTAAAVWFGRREFSGA